LVVIVQALVGLHNCRVMMCEKLNEFLFNTQRYRTCSK
jgi:hypothetical protein